MKMKPKLNPSLSRSTLAILFFLLLSWGASAQVSEASTTGNSVDTVVSDQKITDEWSQNEVVDHRPELINVEENHSAHFEMAANHENVMKGLSNDIAQDGTLQRANAANHSNHYDDIGLTTQKNVSPKNLRNQSNSLHQNH
jgi:hypothetical protein